MLFMSLMILKARGIIPNLALSSDWGLYLAIIRFVYQKDQENYVIQVNSKARNSPTKKNYNEKDKITKPGSSESYLPE